MPFDELVIDQTLALEEGLSILAIERATENITEHILMVDATRYGLPTHKAIFNQTHGDIEVAFHITSSRNVRLGLNRTARFIILIRNLQTKGLNASQAIAHRGINLVNIQGIAIRKIDMIDGEQRVTVMVIVPIRSLLGSEIREVAHWISKISSMDRQDEHLVITQTVL